MISSDGELLRRADRLRRDAAAVLASEDVSRLVALVGEPVLLGSTCPT